MKSGTRIMELWNFIILMFVNIKNVFFFKCQPLVKVVTFLTNRQIKTQIKYNHINTNSCLDKLYQKQNNFSKMTWQVYTLPSECKQNQIDYSY